MRSLIILVVIILPFAGNVFAQKNDGTGERHLLSLNLSEVPLVNVLDTIAMLSDVSFSYSSKKVPVAQRVSVEVYNVQVEVALNQILDPLGISFEKVSGKIILKKAKPKTSLAMATISGYVTDASDGQTLIGATVRVKNLGVGVVSNSYGFYSLTLPSGVYDLQYSYVGYQDMLTEVSMKEDLTYQVDLQTSVSELQELVVTPSDSATMTEQIHNNTFVLAKSIVDGKPVALGEPDVIKALEAVPGIQLFRDGSTYFNVRGGARDQNQILVDEAPIYNPAHFLGLFSSIIPEVTKDIKVYRGDLPARLGGRISSVMDIKTRDGDLKKFHVSGNVGLIAGRLAVEGPIKRDKSSFFVSGRRSYIFDLFRTEDSDITSLFFSDFTAKANFNINSRNRLYVSSYSGRDEFLTDGGINWKNTAGTIRWNHIYNDKLFSNTTIYSSKYEYNLIGDKSANLRWRNSISNATLKMDFTKFVSPTKTLYFGFRLSGHQFNPGNVEDSLGNLPADQPFIPKRNATDFSAYVSKDHKLSNHVLLTYGLRLSNWSNLGRTIEYEINDQYQVVDSTIYNDRSEYNSYANLEPRLSFTYIWNRYHLFKLNYSRSAQYINLISNSISPFNNLEVWLPSSINIKPQLADQVSLGWFWSRPNWQLSVESYHKWMNNQLDYVDQARLTLNPYLEAELRSGQGRAYGIELKLTKSNGPFQGWISYTYARSIRTINGINNDRSYPTLWDRPHQVNVQVNYQASDRTMISSSFHLSSGSPITTPVGFYEFSGRIVPIYGDKNNSRLPLYHRYDISMKYRLNKVQRRFTHYLTFSLFNLYAQKNDIGQSYSKRREQDGEFVVPADLNNAFDITSTKLFVYSVVPSISYSFKW